MPIKTLATVIITVLGLTVLAAPAAHAEGEPPSGVFLTRLSDGTPYGWRGGCSAVVYLDPTVKTNYQSQITWALGMLTARTGITFTETAFPAAANLTYTQLDNFTEPGTETAYAYEFMDHVYLRDPAQNRATYGSQTAVYDYRAVVHETMHWLGLGHDETGIDEEIMGEAHPWKGSILKFGPSDLAGLTYISSLNGCTPPAVDPTAQISPFKKSPFIPSDRRVGSRLR